MARMARVVVPGIPHHITQRGNRRQDVFFSDEDRRVYIDLISEHFKLHKISVWAYCLMDNHVHIIAVPGDGGGLARAIGEAHRMYSRRINFRMGWRGYLWQGRFSSYPMDERHLFAAVRYAERNPVRAKMVKHAEDYRWSSAGSHVFGINDKLLSGEESEVIGIDDWHSYLRCDDREDDLKFLRRHTRTGRPLGDDIFLERMERITHRILRRQRPGPKGG